MGHSLKDFNKILDILAAGKIKYAYRVGQREVSCIYYVYVNKEDIEKAKELLRQNNLAM